MELALQLVVPVAVPDPALDCQLTLDTPTLSEADPLISNVAAIVVTRLPLGDAMLMVGGVRSAGTGPFGVTALLTTTVCTALCSDRSPSPYGAFRLRRRFEELRSATVSKRGNHSAVNRELSAGDIAGPLARKEQHQVSYFGRLREPTGHHLARGTSCYVTRRGVARGADVCGDPVGTEP